MIRTGLNFRGLFTKNHLDLENLELYTWYFIFCTHDMPLRCRYYNGRDWHPQPRDPTSGLHLQSTYVHPPLPLLPCPQEETASGHPVPGLRSGVKPLLNLVLLLRTYIHIIVTSHIPSLPTFSVQYDSCDIMYYLQHLELLIFFTRHMKIVTY